MDYMNHIHFKKENMYKYSTDCDCRECELFKADFGNKYTEAVEFLSQFGLGVEDAVEICDLGIDNSNAKRSYSAYYCVKGTVDKRIEVKVGEITAVIEEKANIPSAGIDEPFFCITLIDIFLPDNEGIIKDALMCCREVEYEYDGESFFITHFNYKPILQNETTGEETAFDNGDELYYEELEDIIEDIEIKFIY